MPAVDLTRELGRMSPGAIDVPAIVRFVLATAKLDAAPSTIARDPDCGRHQRIEQMATCSYFLLQVLM
jgi:hypothetical protein